MARLTRRAFLRTAGASALALGALGQVGWLRRTLWDDLTGLRGEVVRPDDPRYATARLGWNQRHDAIRPQAIVYCADAEDVRRTVAWVRRNGVWAIPRAGGHSYAGHSLGDGVVVDRDPSG